MILLLREDVGDEKMYVYVTVWKYYMKNDFEYGEEGIHVMDIRCSAIISSSNIDVCALLEQEAICSYPFPVANISEVLPYRVTALMSTPFSALVAGQTARVLLVKPTLARCHHTQ